MSHWGWSDSLDMDSNGVIGYVYPKGEFEVIIPDTIPAGDHDYDCRLYLIDFGV
jgi:hypothetical protein